MKKDLQAKEDEVKRLESKVKTLTEENEKSQLNFEKERSALKSEKKEVGFYHFFQHYEIFTFFCRYIKGFATCV